MKKTKVNTWKHRKVQVVHILLSVMVISVLFTNCGAQFFANKDPFQRRATRFNASKLPFPESFGNYFYVEGDRWYWTKFAKPIFYKENVFNHWSSATVSRCRRLSCLHMNERSLVLWPFVSNTEWLSCVLADIDTQRQSWFGKHSSKLGLFLTGC